MTDLQLSALLNTIAGQLRLATSHAACRHQHGADEFMEGDGKELERLWEDLRNRAAELRGDFIVSGDAA